MPTDDYVARIIQAFAAGQALKQGKERFPLEQQQRQLGLQAGQQALSQSREAFPLQQILRQLQAVSTQQNVEQSEQEFPVSLDILKGRRDLLRRQIEFMQSGNADRLFEGFQELTPNEQALIESARAVGTPQAINQAATDIFRQRQISGRAQFNQEQIGNRFNVSANLRQQGINIQAGNLSERITTRLALLDASTNPTLFQQAQSTKSQAANASVVLDRISSQVNDIVSGRSGLKEAIALKRIIRANAAALARAKGEKGALTELDIQSQVLGLPDPVLLATPGVPQFIKDIELLKLQAYTQDFEEAVQRQVDILTGGQPGQTEQPEAQEETNPFLNPDFDFSQ